MSACFVESLTCERLSHPLGIDDPLPRFGWKPRGRQTAYQIIVADSEDAVEDGLGNMWDSGWIQGNDRSAAYAGKPLSPRFRYWFRVRMRDTSGNVSGYSEPSWFETGLFPSGSWPSEWIKAPAPVRGPAHIFLREIDIRRPVLQARAYVAGLGYFELRINTRRSGKNVLDPAWTDYSRKVYYVVHDVTDLLVPGRNTIAVMVASGRYREPTLNLRLYVTSQDKTELVEMTDHRTWWWSPLSPVVETHIYHGETYDARFRVPGWDDSPLADDRGRPDEAAPERDKDVCRADDAVKLKRPLRAEPPGGFLRAQDLEPIRVVGDMEPASSRCLSGEISGVVYDLGQNIAGWARIRVKGQEGQRITLKYSEALRDDGEVEMKMNRGARATDAYILRGEGVEEWEPRFTYHGFRYVQVEYDSPPDELALIGRVVRSSVSKIGSFRCSDDIATRIRTACEWTEGDNLHSLPTDCPQREERMGWLNDMTVRAEPAMYTFDLNLLYAKWAEDIAQAQGKDTGAITDVAPFDSHHTPHFGNRPADPVSSSYLLIPWLSYLHHGDARTLERRYDGLVRWYRYLFDQAENGILGYSYWGDWASPAEFSESGSVGAGAVSAFTPGALVSTCYLHYDALLLSQIAGALGLTRDSQQFLAEATDIAAAFNRRFYDEAQQFYGTGSQACQAIPLALGLVPRQRHEPAVRQLVQDIQAANETHLSTGNLATRYVLEVLSDYGHVDLAWALAVQRTYPSWGFMMDHGATTIWERWEYIRGGGMSSHNHPMYATVSGWFSKYLCGIRPSADGPGFAHVVARPHVPAGLDWAEATLDTVRGKVRSAWRKLADGRVEYKFEIPPSSTARLELPSTEEAPEEAGPFEVQRTPWGTRLHHEVEGGNHTFVIGRKG